MSAGKERLQVRAHQAAHVEVVVGDVAPGGGHLGADGLVRRRRAGGWCCCRRVRAIGPLAAVPLRPQGGLFRQGVHREVEQGDEGQLALEEVLGEVGGRVELVHGDVQRRDLAPVEVDGLVLVQGHLAEMAADGFAVEIELLAEALQGRPVGDEIRPGKRRRIRRRCRLRSATARPPAPRRARRGMDRRRRISAAARLSLSAAVSLSTNLAVSWAARGMHAARARISSRQKYFFM